MSQRITAQGQVPISAAGQRLDQTCAQLFPEFSRARLQNWIKSGELTAAGQIKKVNAKVLGGELLVIDAASEEHGDWQAEDIPLDIIFEDDHLLVINKPPNLVVHPAAGNYSGTLLNGLLNHNAVFEGLPRAGIVHRLDKDTSGLMVVAKTLSAHANLVEQLQARTVKREYQALVQGCVAAPGVLKTQFGRDKVNRKKMAVLKSGGKEAITHYQIAQRYDLFTLLDVNLETGRTHQIRVHLAHLGFPIVGDPVYGKPVKRKNLNNGELIHHLDQFSRQALHARQLTLNHPHTNQLMTWQAPMPEDFATLLALIEGD